MNKSLSRRSYRFDLLAFTLAVLGLLLGAYYPEIALSIQFIGDIFLLLLKMLIIPLVVTSIFLSIAKLKMSEVKSLGGVTIIYYFLTSSLACLTGLFVSNLLVHTEPISFTGEKFDSSKLATIDFQSFITSFFSGNFFNALTEGNIVQIVVFTLLLGMASLKVSESHRSTLINICESIQEMMMIIINWVVLMAPVGVFSLLASLVAKTKPEVFLGLGPLFMAITLAVLVHACFTLPVIGYFLGKFNPFKFIFNCKKALIVALSTASSSATLAVSTQVLLENKYVKPKTAGFVLPLGATLNMDGSALYQSIVIIFIGQLAGMDITLYQEFLIFFFIMTSSAGTSGIPGGGVMMVGAVMSMVGIPLEYIGVYLLVDRFWDYPITMVNVLGDLVGARTIDRYVK